jgi:uncharacterized membrane protein YhaH (DUF805 family)
MGSPDDAAALSQVNASIGPVLTQPWKPAPARRFGEAVAACFHNYANFSGRASRSEFWYFWLFVLLASIATAVVGAALAVLLADAGVEPNTASAATALPYLAALAFVVPYLAVQVRRLHDLGHGGIWVLVNLIPLGGLVLLVVLSGGGQRNRNRWDQSPPPSPSALLDTEMLATTGPPYLESDRKENRRAEPMLAPSSAKPAEPSSPMPVPPPFGAEPIPQAPEGNGGEGPRHSRILPIALGAAIALVLLVIGTYFWGESRRDPQMEEILANASRSEAGMLLQNERLNALLMDFEQRFAESEPTDDDRDTVLFTIQNEANALLPRLIDARAAIREIRVLPWHSDINQFREKYLSHLDAWIASNEYAVEQPENWLFDPSQDVATTWLATVRSAHAAGKGLSPANQAEIIRLFPLSELEPS